MCSLESLRPLLRYMFHEHSGFDLDVLSSFPKNNVQHHSHIISSPLLHSQSTLLSLNLLTNSSDHFTSHVRICSNARAKSFTKSSSCSPPTEARSSRFDKP